MHVVAVIKKVLKFLTRTHKIVLNCDEIYFSRGECYDHLMQEIHDTPEQIQADIRTSVEVRRKLQLEIDKKEVLEHIKTVTLDIYEICKRVVDASPNSTVRTYYVDNRVKYQIVIEKPWFQETQVLPKKPMKDRTHFWSKKKAQPQSVNHVPQSYYLEFWVDDRADMELRGYGPTYGSNTKYRDFRVYEDGRTSPDPYHLVYTSLDLEDPKNQLITLAKALQELMTVKQELIDRVDSPKPEQHEETDEDVYAVTIPETNGYFHDLSKLDRVNDHIREFGGRLEYSENNPNTVKLHIINSTAIVDQLKDRIVIILEKHYGFSVNSTPEK